MRYQYDKPPISHGQPAIPSNLYVVYSRKGDRKSCHVCHTHILLANSPEDAILRLQENAKAVIEAAKKRFPASAHEKVEWVEDPSLFSIHKINELRAKISEAQDKLDDLESVDDDLSSVHRETLVGKIKEYHAQIAELSKGRSLGKESVFEHHMSRMYYLLSPHVFHEAKLLDGDRAYPVSYFDDNRDISNYVGNLE